MIDILEQALVEAGRVRLPSVLPTAAATVLGVLLATGFDFDWRPDLSYNFF